MDKNIFCNEDDDDFIVLIVLITTTVPVMTILASLTSPFQYTYHIITDILGLAHYSRQIVLVRPRNPAKLRIANSRISITEWLEDAVPSLAGTFTPSWWLPNGHFQTALSVVGNFRDVNKVEYERTLLSMPDGGTIGIDITPPNHSSLPPTAPTIIIAHGLTGGSHESYVRNVLEWVVKPEKEGGLGGRGVVANYRGCASVPLTSPQFYSAGYTGDYHTVVAYLASQYPQSPLFGAGYSLGASVLARYMGEQGERCILRGGVVLGCPWDVPAMSHSLETGLISSQLYSTAMGKNLLRLFHRNIPTISSQLSSHPDLSDTAEVVAQLTAKGRHLRLRDVDDVLTCKFGGLRKEHGGVFPFEGAQEYYEWASSQTFIGGVKRPLLAINAFDDPIIDGTSLPLSLVESSSHVILAITGAGGHLGWFDGPYFKRGDQYPQQRWVLKPISEFLKAAVTALTEQAEARKVVKGDDGWTWVVGSEGDLYGRVGWKEKAGHEVVHGAEDGTLQGL